MSALSEPVRTCVGCRRTCGVGDLQRLTLDAEGQLVVGPGTGRGAWLCLATFEVCGAAAARTRGFDRAFRRKLDAAALAAFARHE